MSEVDPEIVETVRDVRNRFGVVGLRDLIALAQQELVTTQAAIAELHPDDDAG